MEILIFIFIIYVFWKKYGKNSKLSKEEMLKRKGFSNIEKISENVTTTYYAAIKRGDNYLISYMKEYLPSMNSINLLAKEMKNRHYHKGILISKSVPAQNLVEYGMKNSIEVTTTFDLKNLTNTNVGTVSNNIKIYEEYQEIKDSGPIKEPSKSFWKDFFKKPDRL